MKQYLLGVRINEGAMPPAEDIQTSGSQVDKINDELHSAGVWMFAGGLGLSDSTTVVRVENGNTTMTDGPFVETKEQLGGFWVIRVADLDEALAWAGKCAAACQAPIEVRPFDPAE